MVYRLDGNPVPLNDDGTLSDGWPNVAQVSVVPGTHSLSLQTQTPQGRYWAVTASSCSDGSALTTVEVALHENGICDFTIKPAGVLTAWLTNQPSSDPTDFQFTAGGGISPSSFTLDDDNDPTLSGARGFVVPVGSGYSSPRRCPGLGSEFGHLLGRLAASNITFSPNENVTCTFKNIVRAP